MKLKGRFYPSCVSIRFTTKGEKMDRISNAAKHGIKIIRTKEQKELLGSKEVKTTLRCGLRSTIFFTDGTSKEVVGDWE